MLYLLFSILCSTLIFIVFKAFSRFGINNVYAIVANYIAATTMGFIFGEFPSTMHEVLSKDWILAAFFIGFLFIALFQIMALTAQRLGVSRVSVPVKMSVVLPVLVGVWLYDEKLNAASIIGIVLALVAVYLGTRKIEDHAATSSLLVMLLPAVLFFGNGSIDVLLKYAQSNWLAQSEMALFSSVLFASAFIWGIFFFTKEWISIKKGPKFKDVLGGIALGIPNFGSIYFLLEALDKSGMQSASVYPINNVAIVGLSAVSGLLIYKEHLSRINIVGLICGVVSIFLIAYA